MHTSSWEFMMSNFSFDGMYAVKIHNFSSDLWNPKKVVNFEGGKITHWLIGPGCGYHLIGKGVHLVVDFKINRDPEIEYIPTIQNFIDNPYYEELKKLEILHGLIHERIKETINEIREKVVDPYLKIHEEKLESIITNKVIKETLYNLDPDIAFPWSKSNRENRKALLRILRQELPGLSDTHKFKRRVEPTIDIVGYVPELHHLIPEFLELRDLLIVSTVHAE